MTDAPVALATGLSAGALLCLSGLADGLLAGLCIAGCLNMQKGRILADAPSRNCVTTVSFLALTSQ